MDKSETKELLLKGQKAWNEWASQMLAIQSAAINESKRKSEFSKSIDEDEWRRLATSDFRGEVFDGDVDFSGLIFPWDVRFDGSEFNRTIKFSDCIFHGDLVLKRSKFSGALLLEDVECEGSLVLSEVKVSGEFRATGKFSHSIVLDFAKFEQKVDLSSNSLGNIVQEFKRVEFLGGVVLSAMNLAGLSFDGCSMPDSDFSGSTLKSTSFEGAELKNSNFSGAHTDVKTSFLRSNVEGCSIDRYSLECMENYGGLSKGAMMRMDILDDVVTLRKSYSGVYRWFHLAAMIVFLFPYTWFFIFRWIEAEFLVTSSGSIYLWEAFLRFVFNGGQNWKVGFDFHWSFVIFIVTLFYNGLRLLLLFKTMELELHQRVTGFPAIFSLSEPVVAILGVSWRQLLKVFKIGMWIVILGISLNLLHFLSMRVPIGF